MSKTRDKTGWNTGRKSEKADGRNLLSCSLRFYRGKLKQMYPERQKKQKQLYKQEILVMV